MKPDLCDKCVRSVHCTISAGRTEACSRFQAQAQAKAQVKPSPSIVFAKELELIKDERVRQFVLTAFEDKCPEYFWYIPASVRGHHPPICRTKGGLVHHTKLAVAFADQLCDAWAPAPYHTDMQRDLVIAAVMLHDMLKRGPTENELDTWATHKEANTNHGRYCADELQYLESSLFGCGWEITRAIRLHMGRWTADIKDHELETLQDNPVVQTCHLADYMASRALHQLLAERSVDDTMRYVND